jgi:hypothetical protein
MSSEDVKKALQDTEFKRIVKEAIREWLDAQFAAFGKWSAIGIASATLGLIAYLLLISSGWHK